MLRGRSSDPAQSDCRDDFAGLVNFIPILYSVPRLSIPPSMTFDPAEKSGAYCAEEGPGDEFNIVRHPFFREMAEGGGDLLSMSLQKLDDELTCPVCQEHFKEPKVLPCLHYYCKTCIANLIKRAPRGGSFNCPECRREALAANNDPERYLIIFIRGHLRTYISLTSRWVWLVILYLLYHQTKLK